MTKTEKKKEVVAIPSLYSTKGLCHYLNDKK
jgi:hypothetical protein